VSVAVPTAPAVTRPPFVTVATVGLPLVHVTVRPLKTLRSESSVVAASCSVPPTRTLAAAGLTVTTATGADVTVTIAVSAIAPGRPFAMIVAVPVLDPAL